MWRHSLKASKMPRTDFVTKPWHGHQCGFHHPKRLLAYPGLHLFLVPARSPSSPVPTDCGLVNSIDLSLTTGSSAGWRKQGPCLALPDDTLWSPSSSGILGLPCPGGGHGRVPAGMMAQCHWRRGLPALCCFSFLSSPHSVFPFPPTSSCHTLGQLGWGGRLGALETADDKSTFPVVFVLLFLWRSTTASEATNTGDRGPGGGWWPSWGQMAEIGIVMGHKGAITQGRVGGGKRAGAACSPTESPGQPWWESC